MRDAENTRDDAEVPAAASYDDGRADAQRRRQLRAAAAAEAGYILSMRCA